MRAIRIGIFQDKALGNCSNNGISARFDHILVEHERGYVDVDENDPPENFCVIERRILWGEEHDFVRPYRKANGVGWMYGGCIVDSSDSRWSELTTHPLRLHDRTESQAEYDMLSM